MFSRSAVYLRHHKMFTPSAAKEVWHFCYHPTPEVMHLDEVADFRGFAEKNNIRALERVTDYRCFKFERNSLGNVECAVKHKMSEDNEYLYLKGDH